MTNHGIQFLKNKYLTFFLTIQIKVRKFNYLYSLLILKTFTQKLLIISFPEKKFLWLPKFVMTDYGREFIKEVYFRSFKLKI